MLAGKERLEYENVGLARALTVRNLDAFAFCEFYGGASDRKVTSVPTCLVRLPTIQPKAILVGARTVSTIKIVVELCERLEIGVSAEEQEGEMAHFCPTRIELTAASDSVLSMFAELGGIGFSQTPSSWQIAHASADLERIIAGLSWQEVPELEWPRADFDVDRCYFRMVPPQLRPRVRLTKYKDPKRGIVRHIFWDGPLSTPIDPDWGRFLLLKRIGKAIMYFDRERNLLAVPKTVRLPRLLARAVTLCSGLLPKMTLALMPTNQLEFIVHEFVPEPLATVIANKLGQQLEFQAFASLL